jgi:multidrug efflux system outer membrane protein
MKLRAAIATLVMLAAGCSLQPAYERPAAPVANAFSGLTDPAPAVDIAWKEFLADPRLQRLVEIALQNNRDLRIAALRVAQVQAQYRIQRATLFPQVNAEVAASSSRLPAGVSPNGNASTSRQDSVGVSAAWELDFFGRLRSLKDAAFQEYLATTHARQAAEILLVSQVADQYLAILAADEELAVTQNTLDAAQAAFKIMQLKFDNGAATELDLRLAQTVVEQAQANRAAQVRTRAQAENALVLLIGQPLPGDLPAPTRLGDQPILADIPAGLPSDLLTRRPDILQAEATLKSENANIGAARAAFFPRIALTADLGSASATLGGLFAAGSAAWSFLPSLAAPIFNAGANRANLDVANLQKDIGIAEYEKAIQSAFREVSDGLAARGTYDDQLAALQRLTDSQQRRLDLADMRYKNGADSYLSVLTAQTDLYNAQLALVSARLDRLTNLVDLYRALGGGWEHVQPPTTTATSEP